MGEFLFELFIPERQGSRPNERAGFHRQSRVAFLHASKYKKQLMKGHCNTCDVTLLLHISSLHFE